MRLVRRALFGIAFVVAFIDIAIFYSVRAINEGRIASQTPPLLEFTRWGFVSMYLLQIAVLFVCWWLLRNNPFTGRLGRVVLNGLLIFLVLRGAVFSYGYASAPIDRARIAQTKARLGNVDRALQRHWASRHALPASLADLALPEEDLQDAWEFRFKYAMDADKQGYRISAMGVPERVEGFEREIRRRVGGEASAN